MGFNIDVKKLQRNISIFEARVDRAVFAAVEVQRPSAESFMRSTAPWTDRSGNARNGLFAASRHEKLRSHSLVLAHSVPYGIWLEIRWSGRYAVVEPSLPKQGAELMKSLSGLFGRM